MGHTWHSCKQSKQPQRCPQGTTATTHGWSKHTTHVLTAVTTSATGNVATTRVIGWFLIFLTLDEHLVGLSSSQVGAAAHALLLGSTHTRDGSSVLLEAWRLKRLPILLPSSVVSGVESPGVQSGATDASLEAANRPSRWLDKGVAMSGGVTVAP